MQTGDCPACGKPLPASTRYCPYCEDVASSAEVTLSLSGASKDRTFAGERGIPGDAQARAMVARTSSAETGETFDAEQTIELTQRTGKGKRTAKVERGEPIFSSRVLRPDARVDLEADLLTGGDDTLEGEQDEEMLDRHATWQKIVEQKTLPIVPALVLTSPPPERRHRWPAPRAFFWLNMLALCILLLAGGFGVALSLAHNVSRAVVRGTALELQASPSTIALGGILTLRGSHFTPGASIQLSRDQHSVVLDTGGVSSVKADAQGLFSDTVVIDPVWHSGLHTLYALDTHAQRQVALTVTVIGKDALQGPPHILLSASTLDLAAGDEATNSSKLLALSNAGGGIVNWRARVSQPWIQLSPNWGSILSGNHQSVIVAIDRSGLVPGSYHTNILFVSNTAQVSLTVMMRVIPLQPEHEAVLQLAPAALTFSGSAQGFDPQVQTITVSNPGVRALSWGATMSLQNGFGWLWMTPQAGSIAPGGQQQITIGVTTRNLPPNVYKAALFFGNQGGQPVQGSPQSIYISLTVTPAIVPSACPLAVTPGSLSFSGVHNQGSPAEQMLHVRLAAGCTTNQSWSAGANTVSGGSWLHLTATGAMTPADVGVSVDTTGLGPGRYNGTLTFSTDAGAQIVPITLTVTPVPCIITGVPTLTLQGTAGQTSPLAQTVTVSSSGDCPHALNWTSAVSGGSWLSAASGGTLAGGVASVNIQASLTALSAGSDTGTVTITVVDSASGATVGTVHVTVVLTVLLPCTLQAPSVTALPFNTSVGNNPTTPSATFTIGVTGNCAGAVTITPTVDAGSGSWLAISGPISITSGTAATFTVTITSSALVAGSYTGTITLSAVDGNGVITGSPQTASVPLTVQ